MDPMLDLIFILGLAINSLYLENIKFFAYKYIIFASSFNSKMISSKHMISNILVIIQLVIDMSVQNSLLYHVNN